MDACYQSFIYGRRDANEPRDDRFAEDEIDFGQFE